MASIATQPDGRRRIVFEAGDGKRRTLRLGKCPLRAAETVRLHVERLLASKLHGSALERDTAA